MSVGRAITCTWGCVFSTQAGYNHIVPHQVPHTWASSWSQGCLSPALQSLSIQKMLAFPEVCCLKDSCSYFGQDDSLLFQESRTGWDMPGQNKKKNRRKGDTGYRKANILQWNKVAWALLWQQEDEKEINRKGKSRAAAKGKGGTVLSSSASSHWLTGVQLAKPNSLCSTHPPLTCSHTACSVPTQLKHFCYSFYFVNVRRYQGWLSILQTYMI